MENRKRVIAKVIMFAILASICGGFGVYVLFFPVVSQSTTMGVVGNTVCGATGIIVGGIYIASAVKELSQRKNSKVS